MRRLIIRKRHWVQALEGGPGSSKSVGTAQSQSATFLNGGMQSSILPFAHCGSNLSHDDGGGSGVAHQLGSLDAVEVGERVRPGLRGPYRHRL
jgi:hypothetical protein